MNTYSITEEQLSRLAELNPEWPDEVLERDELVAKIRTQILIPVEKMRKAFQENYVKTQDEVQKELLKIANEDVAARDRTGGRSVDEL